MNRLRGRVPYLCLAVLVVSVPVAAQTTPRTEISGGYQFVNYSVNGEGESLPAGWYVDVAGNLNSLFGVVFQVGGNYKTFDESVTIGGGTLTATAELAVHAFLGGARVSARGNPAFVPYGQFLVGAINSSLELTASSTIPGVPAFSQEDSATNFALEVGGGVNFGFTENVGIRFGADYLRVFAEEEGIDVFRFIVGVVLRR